MPRPCRLFTWLGVRLLQFHMKTNHIKRVPVFPISELGAKSSINKRQVKKATKWVTLLCIGHETYSNTLNLSNVKQCFFTGSLIHFFQGPWRGLRFQWLLKGIRTLTQSAVRYHKENNHLVHRDTSSEVLPVRLIGH